MSFQTYKCERLIIYFEAHQKFINEAYQIIKTSPISVTTIGKFIGLDYYATARKIKLKKFREKELIKVLEFLK